jgi:hypothetical protein
MKKRIVLLPLSMLATAVLACNLEMQAAPTLSQAQIDTYSAQTLMFLQYQTYAAQGTQDLPPMDTLAPPPETANAATATQTMLPSVTLTGTQMPSPTFTSTVTPTPIPCNWAQFISDVTIPDDWETGPLDHFTKTWRLKNIGSCTWTSGYTLVFDHGDQMGAPASQQLTPGTVAPGGTIDVSVDLLSPAAAGTYQGFFKLRASDSSIFGIGTGADGAFWVKIKVVEPTLAPPAIAPTIEIKYAQATIPHGTLAHATATCPSGSVVTGGGYSVSNSGVWVYTQIKSGNGWVVYAQNNTAADKTLTAYAVCLTYPSVSTTNITKSTNVPSGGTGDITANCPAGSLAVGGGYTGTIDGSLFTYFNNLSGNGWRVAEKNKGATSRSYAVHAVCMSGATASTSVASGYVDIAPGTYGHADAICAGGTVVTSGGWTIDDDLVVYYTSWYSGKWRVWALNTGTHTRTLTVRGTCLTVS